MSLSILKISSFAVLTVCIEILPFTAIVKAEATPTDEKVRTFIRDLLSGRLGDKNEWEAYAAFESLGLEPIETIRTLFSIANHPEQIDASNQMLGLFAGKLASKSSIPGSIFWQALAPEFSQPESRKKALDFIERSGRSDQVFIPPPDSPEMPPTYWAATFERSSRATLVAFQQTDLANPAHYRGDVNRQNWLHKIDLATAILEMRINFESFKQWESGHGVYQPAIDAMDGQCKESLRFLLSHEAWWVRMYGVSVLKRCNPLRTPELVGLLDKETDDKVLYFLREEPKLK